MDSLQFEETLVAVDDNTDNPNSGSVVITDNLVPIDGFHPDDDDLGKRLIAVGQTNHKANGVVGFSHGSDFYIFIHDDTDSLSDNDHLIKLEGITTISKLSIVDDDVNTVLTLEN